MRLLVAPALQRSGKVSAFHQDNINAIEDAADVPVNLCVVHAMQMGAKTVEIAGTPLIMPHFIVRAMRCAVNFNDEAPALTEEIHHIGSDWYLPVKLEASK